MITIRLTFPAARYHATPWGRHVNEGVAEWPPSPYRLLRALYDTWQRKCFDLPQEQVRAVLEALAMSPPRFTLPTAVATHTRSYLSANGLDPSDKNLVFDPFLVFDRPHACFLSWPELEMDANKQAALDALLYNLNYLGRSESWVQAELWKDNIEGEHVFHVAERAESSGELATVACVVPPAEYKGKGAWADALTFSTSDLLKGRASSPPLLRQMRYVLPERAIMTDPPRTPERRRPAVSAVLLSLDATVLPLVTTTLEVSEQIRTRLMGAHRKVMGDDPKQVSQVFSGKSEDGGKRLDHGHVYILPLASKAPGRQGRIDRVLIVNPIGTFTEDELDAIRRVRELWQRDGRPTVKCVATWQGDRTSAVVRQTAVEAISATPFVPARHWRKGRDFEAFLREEVNRECRNHRIAVCEVQVERVQRLSSDNFDVVEYRRNRKEDPVRPGYALKLTFEEPVRLPFAIGYGAHFGLGQFCAAD